MAKVLILFAHPKFEGSRINRSLVEKVRKKEGVTFHDLYEQYPDFNIDLMLEKNLLSHHDIIIWHHPFYWYSCPPLLKQWIDLVLEYNWAYGPEGHAIEGKQVFNVITAGGSREVYCSAGYNNFSVKEFLRPFEQTARLCGMTYLPPFAVMGTHNLSSEDLAHYCEQYDEAISMIQNGVDVKDLASYNFLNDHPQLKTSPAV
ncbi:MAG: NAD(P)H-dependent oxidoreductase [Bacteroidota bacterium]